MSFSSIKSLRRFLSYRLIIYIAVAISFVWLGHSVADYVNDVAPFKADIDLDKKEVQNFKFYISRKFGYNLLITFPFENQEARSSVFKFLDEYNNINSGEYNLKSLIIQIEIKHTDCKGGFLNSINANLYAYKVYSYGNNTVTSSLMDIVFEPGCYEISFFTLFRNPELPSQVKISLGYRK